MNKAKLAVCLLAVVLLAAFVAGYPQLFVSNSALVGVDSSVYYHSWLMELNQKGLVFALQKDRPATLLALFVFQHTAGVTPFEVVKMAPIIYAMGLSCAVFWFVRAGTKNTRMALVAALFSAFAFETVVGTYTAGLANWLAMILAFLFFGCLLKSLEAKSWLSTATVSVLGILLMLTHAYVWYFTFFITIGLLGWTLLETFAKHQRINKVNFIPLLIPLCLNVLFFVIYSVMPFGNEVGNTFSNAFVALDLNPMTPNLANLVLGVSGAFTVWVGGLLANPLLLMLSLVGLAVLSDFSKKFNRLVLLWVAVPSMALFFGSAENQFFYRVLCLVPFEVLAAAGLFWIIEKLVGSKANVESASLSIAIVLLVFFFLLNYALRSVILAPIFVPI
jgi:hypothetical protein